MKIIRSNQKEWEKGRGYSKKVFLSPEDLKSKGNLVQKIVIKPGEKAPVHYHKKQSEIFYFLNDNGYWLINGKKQVFKKGDVLLIEPNDKHEVVNNSSKNYYYIAFKINFEENDSYWE